VNKTYALRLQSSSSAILIICNSFASLTRYSLPPQPGAPAKTQRAQLLLGERLPPLWTAAAELSSPGLSENFRSRGPFVLHSLISECFLTMSKKVHYINVRGKALSSSVCLVFVQGLYSAYFSICSMSIQCLHGVLHGLCSVFVQCLYGCPQARPQVFVHYFADVCSEFDYSSVCSVRIQVCCKCASKYTVAANSEAPISLVPEPSPVKTIF
jgi:hypothetical protein